MTLEEERDFWREQAGLYREVCNDFRNVTIAYRDLLAESRAEVERLKANAAPVYRDASMMAQQTYGGDQWVCGADGKWRKVEF